MGTAWDDHAIWVSLDTRFAGSFQGSDGRTARGSVSNRCVSSVVSADILLLLCFRAVDEKTSRGWKTLTITVTFPVVPVTPFCAAYSPPLLDLPKMTLTKSHCRPSPGNSDRKSFGMECLPKRRGVLLAGLLIATAVFAGCRSFDLYDPTECMTAPPELEPPREMAMRSLPVLPDRAAGYPPNRSPEDGAASALPRGGVRRPVDQRDRNPRGSADCQLLSGSGRGKDQPGAGPTGRFVSSE